MDRERASVLINIAFDDAEDYRDDVFEDTERSGKVCNKPRMPLT